MIEIIESNGHQAYFVGGCVRDLLLDRPIGDIDITTSAPPNTVMNLFKEVIPVGIEHGTVIVRYNKESYEVTTFRVEGEYSDHRHPDQVEFIDQLDKDLERRDFTINALAMDKDGKITDLFHGVEDLQKKVIRTVGSGVERFTEDPLRVIRALRFSSQLGFSIEDETLAAIHQVKDQIDNLAVERITNEMTKFLSGNHVRVGLDYLNETKIYNYLPVWSKHPEIIDIIPRNLQPLGSLAEFFALLHFKMPSISIQTWTKEWKCSNKERTEAQHLITALAYFQDNGLDPWLVYQLPNHFYGGFTRLVHTIFTPSSVSQIDMENLDSKLPIHSRKELEIDGNILIELFPNVKKGPWIQKALSRLEKEVVLGHLENDQIILKEWIKWNPPEIN
ncbi:CCA tRNA nucleotidyltransferase [Ornithinibacillus caprae]|uniref:CCA tRNA nucleotidyltransferase n=1 Tax=Ornithinibacillus caprae TaxID=2678566 RepID=UPI0031B585D8